MANPFLGIITSELKTLYNNAIDSLLADDGLTKPCQLIYGGTKNSLCPNCVYDPINRKSTNRYKAGGLYPFSSGQICPHCNGIGLIGVESTETVYLAIIWDYKQWRKFGFNILSPDGLVVTVCNIDKLPDIKRAKEIIIDTNIQAYVKHRFVREGEPNPMGFGETRYIATLWKRAG